MKNITIIGGGVLGSQIAFQVAYSNFNVTIWARSKESIERTKSKLESLKQTYITEINKMSKEKSLSTWSMGISDYDNFNKEKCLSRVEKVSKNIKFTLSLEESVKNADLVIESMTEDFNAKKELYKKIAPILNEKTIVVTNSSTMLPSSLAKYTKRPDRFLALHFANSIWKNNIAEVMKHSKTSDDSFNKVIDFAKEINMIVLPLQKEKEGYLLNSMLIPFLFSALDLYVNNISDPETIDKAWVLGTSAKEGPFQILDVVGLKTAYEIVKKYSKVPSVFAPYNFKGMEKLLKTYIDNNKLGKSTGEGFYKYK